MLRQEMPIAPQPYREGIRLLHKHAKMLLKPFYTNCRHTSIGGAHRGLTIPERSLSASGVACWLASSMVVQCLEQSDGLLGCRLSGSC